MRTTTGGEATVLASAAYQVLHRFKVANGSGTMVDLSTWVEGFNVDVDIDQPISVSTFQLRRDSSSQSLSPLRSDSTLNRLDDGTTYSPLLDAGRLVTLEVATIAPGTSPISGDWHLLYRGFIDVVRFEKSTVTIDTRDDGGQLFDRWIESEVAYGSTSGVALETTMQAVLDATFGSSVIPLYTPTSPGFLVKPYTQQKQPTMDAQQALAQLPGWDARYRWDDGTSAFRFTLTSPPRSKTIPDFSFGPSQVISVNNLAVDRTNVRNAISVSYLDSATKTRQVILVTDSASIAKYGRRFMEIVEADTSPINTSSQATSLANAALSDLKDPKADQEIELLFWWPADLWDLYRHSPNSIHYDANQDLAVVSVRHEFSRNKHRTKIRTRGSPAGAYLSWRNREGIAGGEAGSSPASAIVAMDDFGRSRVTLSISATGKTPLAYRRRIEIDGQGPTSYPSTFTPIGSGVLDTFSTSPYRATRFFIEIQDGDGNVSAEEMFPIPSWADAYGSGTGQGYASEADTRSGAYAGYSVPGGESITGALMDSTNSIPLLDPVTRRLQSGLSAPSGTGMVDVETGGNRGLGGFTDNAGALVSTAKDSASRTVVRLLAKTLSGDPDTLDGLPEGTSYKRVSVNAVDGSSRIDLSKVGVVGKNGDNISRSSGNTTPVSTVVSRLADTGHPDATMQATDGSLIEGVRGSSRKAGAGQGYVDEDAARSGDGGYATKGNRYSTQPGYDESGTLLWFDPIAREFTPNVIPATGFKVKPDLAVKNGADTTSFAVNRHNEESVGKDNDARTFGVSFDNVPQIRAFPQALRTFIAASSGNDQRLDVRAIGLTVAGFTARAKIITGRTSTARTDYWASTLNGTANPSGIAIAASGAAAYCDISHASTQPTTYVAKFDVDTSSMNPANTLFVSLYKNAGTSSTSWALVASASYGAGLTLTGETLSFDDQIALDYDLRIVVTYQTTPTVPQRATVTAMQVDYAEITGGTEANATPDSSDGVVYQAMEAA